jgi:hypothetical protein
MINRELEDNYCSEEVQRVGKKLNVMSDGVFK